MSRTLLPSILLLLAACTVRPLGDTDSATDTNTDSSSTTSTTTTTATTTSSGDPTTTDATSTPGTASTSEGAPFVPQPDGGWQPPDCDLWADDCPEGQKCMPYSSDGDSSWDSLHCVPIVPDPGQLYEPCTAGPISTGEDTCDDHLMCWNIDPDTEMGECTGMCIGSPDNPSCADPDATCILSGASVLALCLSGCDPILQDCSALNVCIPSPQGEDFICVIDASDDEGQVFDPCEYANVCEPGLMCNDPALAVECAQDALGCCIPFCDTTLPNTCPGEGQVCTPWYAEGQAPPKLEHVGLCTLPP